MTLALLWLAAALHAQPAQPPAAGPKPLSLEEAFALAVGRSEELVRRAASVEEALARADELIGSVLPSVSLHAAQLYQDGTGTTGFSSSFNQTSRFDAKVSAHQPLFSGFREWVAFRAAKQTTKARELDREHARLRLFDDVAQAYVGLLARQQEIRTRRAIIDIHRGRIRELEGRLKIGRSRKSELLAARSRLAQAEALAEQAWGRERSAQEVLRFLTGLDQDVEPRALAVPAEEPLSSFLARAGSRPDIEARRREAESARLSAGVVRRRRWPTVGVDGNYYLERSGIQAPVKWDVLFGLELPLYSGGTISAQTRAAEARLAAAEASVSEQTRAAERDVRSAYQELLAALGNVRALEAAAAAAEANAEAQAEDYRLGMVVNLDVLGSLDELQQTRLALDRARLDASLARLRLDAAAGGLP